MALSSVRTGVITTVNSLAGNQMPDKDKVLYLTEPYQSPMFQWLYFTKGKSEVVINENAKFSWFEDEYVPYQTTITNITGTATSEDNITVTDSTWINKYDILLVEDTEQLVYVDSTESGEIDVTIVDGSTNITACTTGYLKKLGTRRHEYQTDLRESISTKEIEKENYCTIYEETVSTTGRQQAGRKYTKGKSHKDELKKKIREMKQNIERGWLYSTESISTVVDTKFRYTWMEGALGRIVTNVDSYSGDLSEAALFDFFKDQFQKGSKSRDFYCGSSLLFEINDIVKDKYQIQPIARKYGIDVTQLIIPGGNRVNLIQDQMMDGKFDYWGLSLDPKSNIKLRHMGKDEKGPRKYRVEEHVETKATDGRIDKILFDLGLQIPNEELDGWLKKAA